MAEDSTKPLTQQQAKVIADAVGAGFEEYERMSKLRAQSEADAKRSGNPFHPGPPIHTLVAQKVLLRLRSLYAA